MRALTGSWLWCLVVVFGIPTQAVFAQARPSTSSKTVTVGDVPVASVLKRLGANLERGTASRTLDDHSRLFDRTDSNRDGKHTTTEYVENGRYLTPQARSGIFRAADGNGDGVVTKAEYILNRIITDEAKRIVQEMDDDRDGRVERAEFLKHSTKLLSDKTLAVQVFSALDRNADGVILVPEYLRVWGQWARAGTSSAEKRIAARRAELVDTTDKPTSPRGERPGGFGPPARAGSRFGSGPPSPRQFVENALRFDADKDGKLDRQELTKLAESLGRGRGGRGGSSRSSQFGNRNSRFGGRDSGRRPQRPAPTRPEKE